MQFAILLSDFIWDWKYVSWPFFASCITLLWLARRGRPVIAYPLAVALRYILLGIAAIAMLLVAGSFFSTGKGQDRLAHVALAASLLPIWIIALAAFMLPPRKLCGQTSARQDIFEHIRGTAASTTPDSQKGSGHDDR